jgi:hypothetical protein
MIDTRPTTTQRLTAYVILVALLVGSASALASRRELWPFSPYPMYAWVERSDDVERYDLVGLKLDGGEIRIEATKSLWPLDDARLVTGLIEIWRRNRFEVEPSLAFLLALYEERRRAGRHDFPPLSSLRLYRSQWSHPDREARDVDAPQHRTLLFEARESPAQP